MTYSTIQTTAGLDLLAAAASGGTTLGLAHIAVGDGAGNPTTPSEDQAHLVREVYRTVPNRVYQSETDPTHYIAEMLIPADVGGFVMREIGAFDADGTMVVVGNLPDAYKPVGDGSEGAFSDAVIRMEFVVDNAGTITLQVDPNVVIATRAWVLNNVSALPPGGLTGQVLTKQSNTDADADWQDLGDVHVVVETITEDQDLAAGQTVVNLAVTNTHGLAVYVNGARLRGSQWTPHPTIPTRLTLTTAASSGDKLTAAQNEPAGSAGIPLLQAQNLADLADKPTARTNLDVYSRAETDTKAPAGTVMHFAGASAPTGWLKANGAAVSRTAYAALFAVLGTTCGAGDGSSTFNLPDLRGEFLRGLDDGRGVDPGRTRASAQGGQNLAHTHTGTSDAAGDHSHTATTAPGGTHTHTGTTTVAGAHQHAVQSGSTSADFGSQALLSHPVEAIDGSGATNVAGDHQHTLNVNAAANHTHTVATNTAGAHTHALTITNTGGTEARPRNVALLVCIKY